MLPAIEKFNENLAIFKEHLCKNKLSKAHKTIQNLMDNIKELEDHFARNRHLLSFAPMKKRIMDLTNEFMELKIEYNFSCAYHFIDGYKKSLEKNDLNEAKIGYQTIINEMASMANEYQNAVRQNCHKNAIYIDFPQNFSYLIRHFRKFLIIHASQVMDYERFSNEIDMVCAQLESALNIRETQRFFAVTQEPFEPVAFESKPAL